MGKLIIVTGAPASGKSTLAKALQNASQSFKLLSVDEVKIFLSESVGFQ